MMTQTPGDGMFPGNYSVTISDLTVDFAGADEATQKKAKEAKTVAGMPDQVAVSKAYKAAANSVPAKYGQIMTSGLKFEVKCSQTPIISISWIEGSGLSSTLGRKKGTRDC